ncbi:MAG: homoserine kinase [Gemmatimonadetes bacterium]|nr:homoserine kinase [Gemmatimonadota bacterium]
MSGFRPARVRVPGSTSNLGAGFDCIGMAIDRALDVSFTPGGAALTLERAGTLTPLDTPVDDDLVVRAFTQGLATHPATPGGRLEATSTIPLARGLGSSAAATVAGLALAGAAAGADWEPHHVLRVAARIEGHPDNAAPAIFGGLVLVAAGEDGQPATFALPLSQRIAFAYAAPAAGIATRAARAALPASVPHATAVRGLARAAALVRGLADGDVDLLRIGFADELHVPHRLPLIPRADAARDAALDAGAWAVTISGSGSGLVAVCPPGSEAHVARAMADAFGASDDAGVVGFPLRPDPEGARLLPREP